MIFILHAVSFRHKQRRRHLGGKAADCCVTSLRVRKHFGEFILQSGAPQLNWGCVVFLSSFIRQYELMNVGFIQGPFNILGFINES